MPATIYGSITAGVTIVSSFSLGHAFVLVYSFRIKQGQTSKETLSHRLYITIYIYIYTLQSPSCCTPLVTPASLNVGDGAAVVERALVLQLGHSRVVPEDTHGAVLHGSRAHAVHHEQHLVRPARVDRHPELVRHLAHPLPAQVHRVLGRLHRGAE